MDAASLFKPWAAAYPNYQCSTIYPIEVGEWRCQCSLQWRINTIFHRKLWSVHLPCLVRKHQAFLQILWFACQSRSQLNYIAMCCFVAMPDPAGLLGAVHTVWEAEQVETDVSLHQDSLYFLMACKRAPSNPINL